MKEINVIFGSTQLAYTSYELDELMSFVCSKPLQYHPYVEQIMLINSNLWEAEDMLLKCEASMTLDDCLVQLSRNIYIYRYRSATEERIYI